MTREQQEIVEFTRAEFDRVGLVGEQRAKVVALLLLLGGCRGKSNAETLARLDRLGSETNALGTALHRAAWRA